MTRQMAAKHEQVENKARKGDKEGGRENKNHCKILKSEVSCGWNTINYIP